MNRILLLLDHRGNRKLIAAMLDRQYEVMTAEADDLRHMTFDLAILDGTALMRLRDQLVERRVAAEPCILPVLLVTPQRGEAMAARELGTTVDAFIVTPVDKIEFQAHVANMLRLRQLSVDLKKERDTVQKLSLTDDVSGFFNTRFLHHHLDRLLAHPRSREQHISLVFFDMDHFKSVVDTHGHLLGARVLREVAELFDRHLGPEDRIVRYGGDEYVVILPWQTREAAVQKVEQLRAVLVQTPFLQAEAINLNVTASFGIATFPEDAQTKRELLSAADQCLFQSKELGKNRVTSKGAR
jgi:diguanylate cyclase (GGDEF)-like protein